MKWNRKVLNHRMAWLALAITAVCCTGFFAIEITFARIPFFSHLFTADTFYRSLCVHVVFAMLIWLVTFTVFLWHSYIPSATTRFDSLSIWLGTISTILIASVGFFDWGDSYLNDYLPVIHHPVFWTGIFLFVISFLLSIAKYLPHAITLFNNNTEGQLVFYSLVISIVMLLSAGISYITTEPGGDLKLYFQRLFWVPGHIQQFLNACILILSWHFLVRRSNPELRNGLNNNRWIKMANGLLFLSMFPMLGGFLIDPVLPSFKLITVFSYGIGLGVPVLVHTVFLFANLKNGSFAANTFLLSIILYYTGVFIAYGGMNSDLRVTAHYHGVVTALTVALMGLTFFFLKENDLLKNARVARWQPMVFSVGMLILILCLYFVGHYGAPRKTFGFSWVVDSVVVNYLNILAVGAALSVIGGLMFVYYSVASLVNIPYRIKNVAAIMLLGLFSFSFRLPNEPQFLGKSVADIRVFDATGERFLLYELLNKKPTILSPIYTKCPLTCSIIADRLKLAVESISLPEDDFQVVTFSFDTTDTPADLRKFEKRYTYSNVRNFVLSAGYYDVRNLLNSLDFQIEWSEEYKQYDHPNLIIVITPEGKISRYIHGVTPKANDLRIALLEAKKEKTSLSFYEGFLVRCFVYDPATGQYIMDRKFILMIISGGLAISGMLYLITSSMLVRLS
jgi:cytochrome oxidase Cu insertion factor (SCO1/SenC/PrrC family)